MRRYKFLEKEEIYIALNKLRAAFLAASDGVEVDEIIQGVLTQDERLKIGRRIQIAQLLREGVTYEEIKKRLKVGPPTIRLVDTKMEEHPVCYELIGKRERKVEKEHSIKAYRKTGGSKMIYKKKEYTEFNRKDVKR